MSVQRLIRRNSVYYFRCVIPRRISAVLNRKEIRFSLKTASFGEAKRKLVCVNLLIEDYFIKIRQKIHINKYSSNFTMRDIMKFNTNKALALADEYASQTKGDKRLSSEEMLKSYLNKTETKEDTDAMMAVYHSEDISDELYYYKCLCDRYDYGVSAEKELKLAIESGLCKYEDLGKSILLQDLKTAHRRKIELKRTATEDEDYFDVMDVCAHSGKPKNPQKETSSKHYWEDVYKAFKSDPDNRGLSQSTMQERYLRLGTVFRLMDLKNVEDISVETVRNLRRKLMEYPVNCRKLYPKLSPEEAIRQGKADGRKTLEVNTIDGYITALSSLCSYAVKEGYIANNPAAGQGMKKTWEDAKRESKARLPFNEEDLARTFSVASYPKREEDPTRFFIPLIGLHTGMRLNEICQLTVDDIQIAEGVNVINIQKDGDKSVKNRDSERLVPIHPNLVKLGLLEYIEKRKKAGANVRLFDCSKNGRGYFSDNFSKWFKRYKDKAGVRSNVNFHSFRHTFAVKACEANINDKLIDTLAGWSKGHTVGNISMQKRYINELSIKKLDEAVLSMAFPEVQPLIEQYGNQNPVNTKEESEGV